MRQELLKIAAAKKNQKFWAKIKINAGIVQAIKSEKKVVNRLPNLSVIAPLRRAVKI